MNLAPLLEGLPGAVADEGYGPVTVDVPVAAWAEAVRLAREALGCDWFDFLTAVDEADGVAMVCHLGRTDPFEHLLLRTRLSAEHLAVASVAGTYPGARWHERETAEMFGVSFTDAAGDRLDLEPLLLPPGLQGHPLRKDFALQARLDRPWPGARDRGRP